MSLDVYLKRKKMVSYDEGKTNTDENEEVYWGNITHNLGKMAGEAGIYYALWRPEEIGKTKAGEIVELLEKGLADLKARPEHFEKYNSPNGWECMSILFVLSKTIWQPVKKILML